MSYKLSSKWIESSVETPCPICGRTDRDCAITEDKDTACCRTRANPNSRYPQPSDRVGDYVFSGKYENRGVMDRAIYVREKQAERKSKKPIRPKSEQIFEYPATDGSPVARTKRVDDGKGKKSIWQEYEIADDRLSRHWNKKEKGTHWCCVSDRKVKDGKATAEERKIYQAAVLECHKQIRLYRITEARALAEESGLPLFIVEGEGVANSLLDLGIPATTNIGGSKKWNQYGGKHGNYKADVEGLDLVLCPDCDLVGLEHMDQVAGSTSADRWLYANPTHPRWQSPSDGYDLSDWIEEMRSSGMDDEEIKDAILGSVEERRVDLVAEDLEESQPQGKDKAPKQSKIASKLAGKYKNKLAFSAEHDMWFEYEAEMPGAWSQIKDSQVKMTLQQDLEEMPDLAEGFSASYRNGVYDLFSHKPEIYFKKWQATNGIIPFRNGCYSMIDRTFTPKHSPRNYLTYSLPRDYEETTGYPAIEEWLNFVFDGNESQIKLFNYMSAAILRRMWYLQKFLHLQGRPGGGKSVAQRLLSELIGKQNTVNTSLEALGENRFETSRLVGKPLTLLPDQDDYRGSIGTFLQITGNDSVRSERKNRDAVQFQYEGLCCISSNGPAFVSRTGGELTRRQILLMFTKPVAKPDPKFLDKLLIDLPGWTNYLLSIPEGDLLALFKPEDGGRMSKDQWEFKKRVDSIAAWLDECVLVGEDYREKIGSNKTDTSTLFGSYQNHCRNADGVPKGLREFSELLISCLESLFPNRTFKKERLTNGWHIHGIKLRQELSVSDFNPSITTMLFPSPPPPPMNNMNNENGDMNNDYEQLKVNQGKGFSGSMNNMNNLITTKNAKAPNKETELEQNGRCGIKNNNIVHIVHSDSEIQSGQGFEGAEDCSYPLFIEENNCSLGSLNEQLPEQAKPIEEWVKVGARCRMKQSESPLFKRFGSKTLVVAEIRKDGQCVRCTADKVLVEGWIGIRSLTPIKS